MEPDPAGDGGWLGLGADGWVCLSETGVDDVGCWLSMGRCVEYVCRDSNDGMRGMGDGALTADTWGGGGGAGGTPCVM